MIECEKGMKEMETKNIRKIGLDPGFSSLKLVEIDGETINSFLLPATVGLPAQTESGLSLAGVAVGQRRAVRPMEVSFEGLNYLVGPNVADYVKPIHRMDFDRFTDSPELRASIYAAFYKILNGGSHLLATAIALPVTVLQNKTDAERVERGIRGWMVGDHEFTVNGVATRLTVVNVRTRIPQPVAGWFDWGLDNTGQWMQGAEAFKSPTLVIDQGFNTLDVLAVCDGKISQRHSGGETLGMRRAAERLAEIVKQRYSVYLDLLEADKLIRQVGDGEQAKIYVDGEAVVVNTEAKQALQALEADAVQFIERILSRGRMYRVLLTGGGALSLMRRLLQMFPTATVLYDPVMANARGLAKLANRQGFLD